MDSKLKAAIIQGAEDHAKALAEERQRECEERTKKEGERARREKAFREWLLQDDRIYKLVRKAIAEGRTSLKLDGHEEGIPDHLADRALESAVNSIKGFRAHAREEDHDMGDSCSPCLCTFYHVEVFWETK